MKPTDNEDDERGFFRRNLVMLILGGLALVGGGYVYATHTPSKSTGKKKIDMVSITMPSIPPPPPPPPPPKQEEPPPEKEEEMVAQEEVKQDDQKPDDKPADKPADEPLGTAIGGGTGGGLGLGGGGGGGGIGGNGGKGGSKWGWYAGQVQSRLADALRSNLLTKRAGFSNVIKIWSDSTGRITRVKLTGSTGDPKVDAAIENEVFNGLVLSEPPPDGMPMPINLRLTARKAN
jgi:protein TonB